MKSIFPQWLRLEYRLAKVQGRLIQLSTWEISPLVLSNRVLSMENRCSCFLVWIDPLFYLLVARVEDNAWNFNTWKISTVSLSVCVVNLPLTFADVYVFFLFLLMGTEGVSSFAQRWVKLCSRSQLTTWRELSSVFAVWYIWAMAMTSEDI